MWANKFRGTSKENELVSGMKSDNGKNYIVVAVSGGFDPLHIGHARMFEKAKKLGDKLVVILNNDNWLVKKKGYSFMKEEERAEIIKHLRWVDDVIITKHVQDTEDMSVCEELRILRPDIFANGGDRKLDNVPEVGVCEEINCKMVFNIGEGGKVQSSSWLLSAFFENQPCSCGSGKKYKACGLIGSKEHQKRTLSK